MNVTIAWVVAMKQNNERETKHTTVQRKICVSSGQMLMVLLNEEVKWRETKRVALVWSLHQEDGEWSLISSPV